MAFTLLQAGTTLQSLNAAGALSSALALPSGITLRTNLIPRFARFNRMVVVVNSPTRPLMVDDAGVVRPLVPLPPASALVLSTEAGGALTGTYLGLQTFLMRDSLGNILAESDYGPAMANTVAIAAAYLRADNINLSPDAAVTDTKLYRTATNGGVYFPWAVLNGNTQTAYRDDLADAALGLIAAPDRGSVPDLTLVCEWGGRLWGVDRSDVDDLRYTETGTSYAWSALNTIPIAPVGGDNIGITGFVPRRAGLGVGRKSGFSIINGTSRSNFQQTLNGNQIGLESQESVVVYNDTAYFLWRDGVYAWGTTGFNSQGFGNGFSCVSDNRVRSWFTTDTYFNRSMFWRAIGQLDPVTQSYRLYLAAAGTNVINRWVELDLSTGAWFGPHKTDAFTITSAFTVFGSDQKPYPVIGSQEGFVSLEQDTKNDWELTPVDFSVETKIHDQTEPHLEKVWGELSISGAVQPSGSVVVTPKVGDADTMADTATMAYDMTKGSQRLEKVGFGTQMSLQFEQNTLNVDTVLYGYELPVNIVGRR